MEFLGVMVSLVVPGYIIYVGICEIRKLKK
jgi:hypothetical protein